MSTTEKKNNNSMMHLSHSEKGEGGKIGKKKKLACVASQNLKKESQEKKMGRPYTLCWDGESKPAKVKKPTCDGGNDSTRSGVQAKLEKQNWLLHTLRTRLLP